MTADFPFECDGCSKRRGVLRHDDGWTKRQIGEGRGAIIQYLCPDCHEAADD